MKAQLDRLRRQADEIQRSREDRPFDFRELVRAAAKSREDRRRSGVPRRKLTEEERIHASARLQAAFTGRPFDECLQRCREWSRECAEADRIEAEELESRKGGRLEPTDSAQDSRSDCAESHDPTETTSDSSEPSQGRLREPEGGGGPSDPMPAEPAASRSSQSSPRNHSPARSLRDELKGM